MLCWGATLLVCAAGVWQGVLAARAPALVAAVIPALLIFFPLSFLLFGSALLLIAMAGFAVPFALLHRDVTAWLTAAPSPTEPRRTEPAPSSVTVAAGSLALLPAVVLAVILITGPIGVALPAPALWAVFLLVAVGAGAALSLRNGREFGMPGTRGHALAALAHLMVPLLLAPKFSVAQTALWAYTGIPLLLLLPLAVAALVVRPSTRLWVERGVAAQA